MKKYLMDMGLSPQILGIKSLLLENLLNLKLKRLLESNSPFAGWLCMTFHMMDRHQSFLFPPQSSM
jgi:hypothetical protein